LRRGGPHRFELGSRVIVANGPGQFRGPVDLPLDPLEPAHEARWALVLGLLAVMPEPRQVQAGIAGQGLALDRRAYHVKEENVCQIGSSAGHRLPP